MKIKAKDIKKMSKEEIEKKLKELKAELIKSKASPVKTGSKSKEIRKIIARLLTLKSKNGNMSKMRLA